MSVEVEKLNDLYEKAKQAGLSESVEDYLCDYFRKQHSILWRKLCNARPDLSELLDIKSQARAITLMEQELLRNKIKGKDALKRLKEITEYTEYTQEV